MTSRYDRFKLTFQLTAHGDGLEVRLRTLAGQCRAETSLPPQDVLDRLLNYNPANIPTPALGAVGQALYQRLMAGDASRLASIVFEDARRQKWPVHFELRFDPDQARLAQYPWEMISDELGRFLVRDGLVDLTRYISYPQPPGVFDAAFHGLPILQVISRPRTLQPLVPASLAVEHVERLLNATFEQFQYKLLIERLALWGLHFDGHGGMALQCRACETLCSLSAGFCSLCGSSLADAKQVGVLAFERDGDVEWITTEQLGSVLYNAQIRLALLLACETARIGDHLVFSGLAPGLILAGVPAVVGMQYPVTDLFASSFANGFYARLLRSNDLLDAMRAARALQARESWYSPVLYLRHLRVAEEEPPARPIYQARSIDTAVPAEVQAGVEFLVRLWIRRPATPSLTPEQLRKELGILTPVPISKREVGAELKLEPVEGRKLRRGAVDVACHSPACQVFPERMTLFVDEHLDAPPAIFTVRASRTGRTALFFTVWQDGGEIASIAHPLQVLDAYGQPGEAVDAKSCVLPVQEAVTEVLGQDAGSGRGVEAVRLVVQSGPQAGSHVVLSQRTISIGRSSSNDLPLQDIRLSRNHAEIRWQGGGWLIADLGSTNGTFVNGVRIAGPCQLQPGDRIGVGNTTLLVLASEATGQAAADRTEHFPSPPAPPASATMLPVPAPGPPSSPAAVPAARGEGPVPASAPPPPRKRSGGFGGVGLAALLSVLLMAGVVGLMGPALLGKIIATPQVVVVTEVVKITVTIVEPPTPIVTRTPTPALARPQAEFLGDVTIPDGTVLNPGEPFTKIWRFRNSGHVPWGAGLRLVFVEGVQDGFESYQMEGPAYVEVSNAAPGETVDVSVDLRAPSSPGRYRSYWRLRLASGAWLAEQHYAEIVVLE
jgi:hypothetical protein